jgi:hypothetical protein
LFFVTATPDRNHCTDGVVCPRWTRRTRAAVLVVVVGLAASGCMMGRSEFARPVAQSRPASQPMVLPGASLGDQVGSIAAAEPVVAVASPEPETEPMALSDPQPLPAGAAGKPAPADPKSKVLSPEEKARLIAELEALARSQDARAPASDPAACNDAAATAADPEKRLNGDFGTGGC